MKCTKRKQNLKRHIFKGKIGDQILMENKNWFVLNITIEINLEMLKEITQED